MSKREREPKITITPQNSGRVVLRLGIIALVVYLVFQIDILAIVSCMLLAAYGSSSLLAQAALSGATIKISTKQLRTHCGESIDARIHLKNKNKILPIYFPTINIREKTAHNKQAFQFRGIVLPGQEITLAIDPTLNVRGLRQLEAQSPSSHFPFALHLATSAAQATTADIIVWPKAEPFDVDSLLIDPPRFRFDTSGEQSFHSQTTEAARIREYQAGDPKPFINWKLSAKLDKLTVIEPRNERQERYELHLETSRKLWKSELAFERMLRLVTNLVSELSRRKIAQGITIDSIHYPLTNNRQLIRFFDTLAVATPNKQRQQIPAPAQRMHLWILPAPHSEIRLAQQFDPILQRETVQ